MTSADLMPQPEYVAEAVEVLTAAATLLEHVATAATPGPWERKPAPRHALVVAPTPPDEQGRPEKPRVMVARAATWEPTGKFVRGRSGRDLDWIALMSPAIATALIEVLYAARSDAEEVGPDRFVVALAGQLLDAAPDPLLRRAGVRRPASPTYVGHKSP
jgi:hypothetical protein